jgi:hypothetical protein
VSFQDAADMRLSNVENADFEYPVFAIGVDSLSGNIVDCSFTSVDSAAIYVPRDTRIVEGYQWSFDAPMTVMVSNTDASPSSHGGEDTLRVEINVNGGLFTEDPTPSGDLVEFVPRTADHFEGKAWYGASIVGTGWSGDGKGVARIHDAKFDSAIFPLSFLIADTAEVADSEFWHYQDTGVTHWASDAVINRSTFVRDLISQQPGSGRDGRTAIHSIGSVSAIASDSIFYHTDYGIRIDAGSYAECTAQPSGTTKTISVSNNVVAEDQNFGIEGSLEVGIQASWVCNHRNLSLTNNLVDNWAGYGVALDECSDVIVKQNCITDNDIGMAHKRRYITIEPVWNDVNKAQWNNLRESLTANAQAGASPLASPTDSGLRLGKSGVSATEDNRLEQGAPTTRNYKIATTEASRTDYVESSEWFDHTGALLATDTDIENTVQKAVGSQTVDWTPFVSALADTAPEVPKGAACTPPTAPSFSAQAVRVPLSADGSKKPEELPGAEEAPIETARVQIPDHWALGPPQPNPAQGRLGIDFSVPPGGGEVDIVVYNVEGRRVISLTSGLVAPGYRTAIWDGRDAFGRSVSPGVYFVRMTSPGFTATRKAVLLR